MENELLQFFSNIPTAGAAALIGYLLIVKVLSPLTNYYINRRNGTGSNIEKKVKHIENNCLQDINRRLDELEKNDVRIEQGMYELGRDVSWLKGRLNNKL